MWRKTLVILGFALAGAVPRVINYQGKIVDASGVGINDTIPIVFKLYTSETGGSPIWVDTIPDVVVRQGLFSVELGAFPDSVNFSSEYWLEIEVNGEAFEPRERLVSSPYSIRAGSVERAIHAVRRRGGSISHTGTLILSSLPGATISETGDSIFVFFGAAGAPTADFALNINQASISVYRGSSITNRVGIILLTPGAEPTVALSVDGLPEGATATFTPPSCTPSCASTMTITTTGSTPPGTYTIMVIGTSAEISRTATFTLTVNIPFDYELVLAPDSASIDQGSQTSTIVTANLITGFPENVTFSVSGLPTGSYATFSPTSCILSCNSTLTIQTSVTTPPGRYPCQITAMTSSGVVRTITFVLRVNYFRFTLSLSSSSGTIDQGGSISTTLTATRVSEVTQTLSFSLLPSPMYDGITATLTSASCNPTCNTMLNITASQTVTPGVYPIDIVATGVGGATDTIRYTLTINYFNFTLSLGSSSGTIDQGENISTTLTVTRVSPVTQRVDLSLLPSPMYEGITATLGIMNCEPTCNTQFSIVTSQTVTPGVYPIDIVATGVGGATDTIRYTLTINYFNFTLSLSPSSGEIATTGGPVTSTVTATRVSPVTQEVTFTHSTPPANVSISISPTACNPTCNATMSITTSGATIGTYPIDVIGTGVGGGADTATYTLTVCSVPSAPQNLTATGGIRQVVLNWQAPSSDGPCTTIITNYRIYRSTSPNPTTLLTTVGNVLTYTDTAVTVGQTYYYRVTAVNAEGEGPYSNEVNAIPRYPYTCRELKNARPGLADGLYMIQPQGASSPFQVYCNMTVDGGGWASIFQLSGNLSLSNRNCIFYFSNDDHDSYIMWSDLTTKLSNINNYNTDSQNWYTWQRDGTQSMSASYLTPRPSGMGSNARPVPFPAMNKVVWFDWQNGYIRWDSYSVSFSSVGLSTSMGDGSNFYFITDGVNMVAVGPSGGSARLLTFNFATGTIESESATFLSPTGGWYSTEEDAFGHVLWTVNGRVLYLRSCGTFTLGGSPRNPNSPITDYSVSYWGTCSQPGLDFFGRVDNSGYLWFVDWGHDDGGYFGCGNDNYLGVAQSNIMLTY